MEKIVSNRCDKQGNVYITFSDILGKAIHYDNDGKFEYIQSSCGDRYTDLQNMKMDSNLKLIDPTAGIGQNNIIAGNTAKSVEIKSNPEIESCVKLNQEGISIDTMRHGCSIKKLLGTDDTIKINLKDGIELNQEFARLGGTVNFIDQNYRWINLGLNEYELSQHKIKITDDCGCKPDIEAFKEFREDIIVKSESGQKAGSVNLASWFFRNSDLFYDLRSDDLHSVRVGKDNVYLKVLPCNEAKKYYKLALCDKDGNLAEKTQKGIELNSKGEELETDKETAIYMSKCNLIDGQKIQLKDFYREDEKPSFIIKPSTSKEFGEAVGSKSRAEVYEYDPVSHDIGDKVGKLNATDIRVSDNSFIIDNLLLDNNGYKTFHIDSNM